MIGIMKVRHFRGGLVVTALAIAMGHVAARAQLPQPELRNPPAKGINPTAAAVVKLY